VIAAARRHLTPALVAVPVLVGLALWASDSAPASARPVARIAIRACASYPRPGTTSTAATPAGVRMEFGVLGRPRRARDRIAVRRLGLLPESGILVNGIRLLGRTVYGGRAYMVPSLHLLSSPLVPARCVSRSQRAFQVDLLPKLHREYGHRGLCLVIVYEVGSRLACQSAPGPVDSLLTGPGTPGLGIVPDGVPAVRLDFPRRASIRATVHDNFWIIDNSKVGDEPCGLDWITRGGVVLRTVASCNASSDTD
jgi:hypothetical protein